jgi:hypothetical protein
MDIRTVTGCSTYCLSGISLTTDVPIATASAVITVQYDRQIPQQLLTISLHGMQQEQEQQDRQEVVGSSPPNNTARFFSFIEKM